VIGKQKVMMHLFTLLADVDSSFVVYDTFPLKKYQIFISHNA